MGNSELHVLGVIMEDNNNMFKMTLKEVRGNKTGTQNLNENDTPISKPVAINKPVKEKNSITDVPREKLIIPTPEMFPIYEGMPEGERVLNTKLRGVSQLVNFTENTAVTDKEKEAVVFSYYHLLTGKIPQSLTQVGRDLYGVEAQKVDTLYDITRKQAKKLITYEPIVKYNEETPEERKAGIMKMLKETGRTKTIKGKEPLNMPGGMYSYPTVTYNPKEVPIDDSPEAWEKYEVEYKNRALLQTSPLSKKYLALQDTGKSGIPIEELVNESIIVGQRKDKSGAKRMVLEKYGSKGDGKHNDYTESNNRIPLMPSGQGMVPPMNFHPDVMKGLTPSGKATVVNILNNDDNVLNIQNVMDSKIIQLPDQTYASFINAIGTSQSFVEEGDIKFVARSSYEVAQKKFENLYGYFKEGQGYDLVHLYDNASSIYKEYQHATNGDETPFYPDGSVKTKYLPEAKKMYYRLGELPDTQDKERKFMSMSDWLDHGLHDYYEVGKTNNMYESRVRRLDQVLRVDYTGEHGVIAETAGAVVGTLVEMGTTAAISLIPVVGTSIAIGTLYASEQYDLETTAIDAGVRPDQARFWSSILSLPYALSEYMEIKALSPKLWRPILEDIRMNPKLLHRSVLVGLGIKTEGSAFTAEELKLLKMAEYKWGFKNYLKITGHETAEEYVQAGIEYGYWAALAISNPDNINLRQKEIEMYRQMLGATIIMPFVTAFGMGMVMGGARVKNGKSNTIEELNNLSRDETLLVLANNSVAQQLESSGEFKTLNDVPADVRNLIDSLFGTIRKRDLNESKNRWRVGKLNEISDEDVESISELGQIEPSEEVSINRRTGSDAINYHRDRVNKKINELKELRKQLKETLSGKSNPAGTEELKEAKKELIEAKKNRDPEAIKKAQERVSKAEAGIKLTPKERVEKAEARANEIRRRIQLTEKRYNEAKEKLKRNRGNLSLEEKAELTKIATLNHKESLELRKELNELKSQTNIENTEEVKQLRSAIKKAEQELQNTSKEVENEIENEDLIDKQIDNIRRELIRKGYTNPDEIIYSVRKMLELQEKILKEVEDELKAIGIQRINDILSGDMEIEYISNDVKFATAERLHNIFKEMGSDVELDIVDNPEQAKEKYGIDDAESRAAFFHRASNTIVLISSNIKTAEDAESRYIHEAVHVSKTFENMLGGMIYSSMIDYTNINTEKELREKAEQLLSNYGGMTDEQMAEMSDEELFAELGAVVISSRIGRSKAEINNTPNEMDNLFRKLVENLQSKYTYGNIRRFFEAVIMMNKGIPKTTWDITEEVGKARQNYIFKVLIKKLTGYDIGIKTSLESLNLSKEEKEILKEYRTEDLSELDMLLSNLEKRSKKEGWSKTEYEKMRKSLIESWGENIGKILSNADLSEETGNVEDLYIEQRVEEFINDIIEEVKNKTNLTDEEVIKRVITNVVNGISSPFINTAPKNNQDAISILGSHFETVVNEVIDKINNGDIPSARTQSLDPMRELALRIVEQKIKGKPISDIIPEGTPKKIVNEAKRYAKKIEDVMANRKISSPREAEVWASAYEIIKKQQSRYGKAKKTATIKVINDSEKRVKINEHLRKIARWVLSSQDIRKFNDVETAIAIDKKIEQMIEDNVPQSMIEKEINRIYEEYLENNEKMIGEIVSRMARDTEINPKEYDKTNTETGSIIDTPAGIAVSRELFNNLIEKFKSYTPSRAKLIANAIRESWKAKTRSELITYATNSTIKMAYRPIDKEAKIALKELFRLSNKESKNLPWYKRKLTKENLGMVRRWKKLYNMTKPKAEEYIKKKMDTLMDVVNNNNSTFKDVMKAKDELVEAQKFAGLKNESPSAYTDAMDFALNHLDEEEQRKAQSIIEEFERKKNVLLKALNRRKGKKIIGSSNMSFFDLAKSIFGESEDVTEIVNELRDLYSLGTEDMLNFFMNYGMDSFFDKLTGKTGLKIPQLRKKMYELSLVDGRFDECLLDNKTIQMSPDEAIYAFLAWSQEDQRSKAEITYNMDKIRANMNEFEYLIAETLQDMYAESGIILGEELEEKTGIRIKTINKYAPIRLASDRMASAGVVLRGNVVPDFAEERTENKELLTKVGAMQVFESHIADGAVFYGMFDTTMFLNNIYLDPEVLRNVKYKYGDDTEKMLREFGLGIISQRSAQNATLQSHSKIVRGLLALQITPILFNPRSAIRQFSSANLFALENDASINPTILEGWKSWFTSKYDEARDFITNSASYKVRKGEALSRVTGLPLSDRRFKGEDFIDKLIENGLSMNKWADRTTILYGAPVIFQNHVDRLNEQGAFAGDQEKVKRLALARTMSHINATQQSTQIAYRSWNHLHYGVTRSLVSPFTSTLQQYFSYEARALHTWREAEGEEKTEALKELARIAFWNHIMSPFLFMVIGEAWNVIALGTDWDDKEKEKFYAELGISMLLGPMAGAFWTGTLIKAMIETGLKLASGLEVYDTDLIGGLNNTILNPKSLYKSGDEFLTVMKEGQFSSLEDIVNVASKATLGMAQPIEQIKKLGENRVWEE